MGGIVVRIVSFQIIRLVVEIIKLVKRIVRMASMFSV